MNPPAVEKLIAELGKLNSQLGFAIGVLEGVLFWKLEDGCRKKILQALDRLKEKP